MESTIDHKQKRLRSISPNFVAKKQSDFSVSVDKKLDVGVLLYRNRKLKQQLEALKVENSILESKISHIEDKQVAYDNTIDAINKSWEQLVDNLGRQSNNIAHGYDNGRCDTESSGR